MPSDTGSTPTSTGLVWDSARTSSGSSTGRRPGRCPREARQRRKAIRARALDWVEQNPYDAVFMERLPAKSTDRRQTLAAAVALMRANAAKERAYLADAGNAKKFRADRTRNGTDAKYCWKS